ncbi:MAG: hypothetical protein ACLQMH_15510 [Solirubrobacteraceae bacterium]
MSDYFDRVEQGMREAVRRGAHIPWYARVRLRPSRPVAVVLACLVVTGSALAATGAFRTGAPVGAEVPAIPTANEGAVLPASIALLSLRVSDPDGGPPWGLRELKTTRGLMCLQVGRIVDGRLGVLGRDGAFLDDGAFHPLSRTFMEGPGCGTEDGRGDAFVDEQLHGLPASGLMGDQLHTHGGCYGSRTSASECPPDALRDVYFGLLGPDATSVTHLTPGNATATTPTAGPDGAYLIVLPHSTTRCPPHAPFCFGNDTGFTGSPQMEAFEVVRAVSYRGAAACVLPTPAAFAAAEAARQARFQEALRARFPATYAQLYRGGHYVRGSINLLTPAQQRAFQALRLPYERGYRSPSCPAVGYVPLAPAGHITPAQIASAVSAHVEPARHYCERDSGGMAIACDPRIPSGYRRIDMSHGPPQQLLVVEFTARAAVTNFDRHYEINTSDPNDPANPHCPGSGGGTFGPTDTNLRAGQRGRYTEFFDPQCPGVAHITVGLVTVNGPSGSMPVPGLPGQSPEIPVGHTSIILP